MPAKLHSNSFPDERDRNLCRDLSLVINGDEIRMENIPAERVVLKIFQKRQLTGAPIQFEVNQHISGSSRSQHLTKPLRTYFDVPVFGATSIYHGGDESFPAHALEHATTRALAIFRFE